MCKHILAAVMLLAKLLAADPSRPDPTAAHAAAAAMRSLPADLHHWHYYGSPKSGSQTHGLAPLHGTVTSATHRALPRRLWDREDLRSAFVTPGRNQLHMFLAKLHAGQPVTVVAFGDSIVEKHGGCFHRSMEHLAQHGVSIPSSVYTRSYCSNDLQTKWLSAFMHLINATWPHADHLLVNNGLAGTPLREFVEASCLEFTLPTTVDLVILEQLVFVEDEGIALAIERLVHRIWLHGRNSASPGPLPVIILNMDRARTEGRPAWEDNSEDRCLRNGTLCATVCPTSFRELLPSLAPPAEAGKEARTHALARHRSFASISHKPLVQRLFAKFVQGLGSGRNVSDVSEPEDLPPGLAFAPGASSECEFFAAMFKDNIHPGVTGGLLLADLLVSYVADADKEEQQRLRKGSSSPTGGIPKLMPPWLVLDSMLIPHTRCYGSLVRATGSAPFEEGRDVSEQQMLPIRVTGADRWAYIENEGGAGGRTVFKPGWTSAEVGAMLRLELDAEFKSSPTFRVARGAKVAVLITYLTSYEHMGRAKVSCVSGCECDPGTMEGHEDHWHHSLTAVLRLEMTVPHHACVLQVEVLEGTSSGEHKVKVLQLTVSTMWNATAELAGLMAGWS